MNRLSKRLLAFVLNAKDAGNASTSGGPAAAGRRHESLLGQLACSSRTIPVLNEFCPTLMTAALSAQSHAAREGLQPSMGLSQNGYGRPLRNGMTVFFFFFDESAIEKTAGICSERQGCR
mmetsp:Transcript_12061/g.9699  ORF Transcript_12061/g.9699 Transcript_12061/m.9699 type:complete len:120 (-) Transcript_12061:163-522(-)